MKNSGRRQNKLTRRDALKSVAAGGLALACSSRLDAAQAAPDIIDAHSHIWTPDVAHYPLANGQSADALAPPSFTAEELLALAQAHGVRRVVLIQHKPYHGLDHRYLADAIAAYPQAFRGVACVDAAAARPDRDMLRLKALGFRGFRITPGEGGTARWSASEGQRLMWACAGEQELAICPLIGPDHLDQVDEMCRRFPKTTVVIDHFARIGGDGRFRESDLDRLAGLSRHARVRVKVSAFYFLGRKAPPYDDVVPMIRRLVDAYGADRLMWGSDSPYQLAAPNTYAASVRLVAEGLEFLSPAERRSLLCGTAESVFFT